MRVVDMKKKLEDEHNCQIHYDTVWKGRDFIEGDVWLMAGQLSDVVQLEG